MPTLEQIKTQLPEYLKNLLSDVEVMLQEAYENGYAEGFHDATKQMESK